MKRENVRWQMAKNGRALEGSFAICLLPFLHCSIPLNSVISRSSVEFGIYDSPRPSCQHRLDNLPEHIRQSEPSSLVLIREPFVVDAQ